MACLAPIENLIAFWKTRRPLTAFSHHSDGEPLDPPLDAVAFRVVQECVSNAIRHGDPGSIHIAIDTDDERAIIVVEDDGAGFSDGVTRFGFGLTGMNERVRSVGGTLSVINQAGGRGVSIRAVLPLGRAPGNAGQRRDYASGGQRMKLLLVDDHAIVREGVRRLLSLSVEATVLEAKTGREALAVFKGRETRGRHPRPEPAWIRRA